MCGDDATRTSGERHRPGAAAGTPEVSRRQAVSAVAATAAMLSAGGAAGAVHAAPAAPATGSDPSARMTWTLLGTNAGPPPLGSRFGIANALVVNGRTYVVDCGRGAASQYMRAGLSMPSLAGIFLTHLHADHIVDYFSFPLLAAGSSGARGFRQPIDVYGPGPAGVESLLPAAPGPVPGTAAMTELAVRAYAAHSTFFVAEHIGVDPTTLLNVHEVMPPADTGASPDNTAPPMAPFTVLENDDVKVSAVLVPHGAAYPSYAYRFDTDHGTVVFSGDTAPTPNILSLAAGADVLVHEAQDIASLIRKGVPPALVDHLRQVHTEVSLLGGIAAAAEVGTLVATHLGPGDARVLPDAEWRKLLLDSATAADFRGNMILGEDLMCIPVGRPA